MPPFTDKARTVDYIKANHSGMIGVYPSVAGFYTNWADISRPRYFSSDNLMLQTVDIAAVVGLQKTRTPAF